MRIRNRFGRIVEVPESLGSEMIKKGEATLAIEQQTPFGVPPISLGQEIKPEHLDPELDPADYGLQAPQDREAPPEQHGTSYAEPPAATFPTGTKPKRTLAEGARDLTRGPKLGDIIIPHHDRHEYLRPLLERIPLGLFNIFIVSGGSFARNCNLGAKLAQTENLIFLNDDVEITEQVLREMCANKADMIGATQIIPSMGNKAYYGIGFWFEKGKLQAGLMQKPESVHIPCGFLFGMKKKAWEKLGGLDEGFINGGEDSDLGLRALKAKMKVDYITIPVIHHHSQSEGRLIYSKENQQRLEEKWPAKEVKKLFNLSSEKIRILLGNNHLDRWGGSETFTRTLYKELERRGHDVAVFTLRPGVASEGLNVVQNPKAEDYDLALISHNTILKALAEINIFKICTSHGPSHALEAPVDGANRYVAVSDEVAKAYDRSMTVIHNGIDLERFKPTRPLNKKLTKVGIMCQGAEATTISADACRSLGIEYEVINQTVNVEEIINSCDLVVSLGRGAYEAMACGRAVIVFDSRSYQPKLADGIVTKENFRELLKCNFSGRRYNKKFLARAMATELKKYKPEMGPINRALAEKTFDIKKAADKYIELYEQLSKN